MEGKILYYCPSIRYHLGDRVTTLQRPSALHLEVARAEATDGLAGCSLRRGGTAGGEGVDELEAARAGVWVVSYTHDHEREEYLPITH